ncbi:H/ACA ribonucleoprotein complex subunit 2-like protein [Vespula maculifrons]|uniref:H/ACA snoRNP protein NHP2 n=1 Tax=Vespula maculifrons TaxID=7453 RepID=A0ABD2BB22_VESMC|nr:H/ACA ribonucleoprotein complex subunit 2-like protein [Vespula pensylvanica]XP_043670045.1 H/ACA ribonucleoprotein complex subunit 2-like protein [Vespula pensylvanica]XP_050851917.1 H/ACA ribonucleoprotein complex subunit 2-like protein [Vespula vulgaris]XP_050851918.1 H/ACA ribonucleoprotein complex subunit 2-like protein [Vespula vulgaris]XP_050851919.1 H/ACA ribonucleoprotein complex subunit 2-like protein [Vespula vulgaris]
MNESVSKMEVDESLQEGGGLSYEDKLKYVNSIATPMASRKLAKKIYKCIKKASKHRTYLRNGLKDVQKHIRKGEKGLVVFAGDVFPIEIMCHLPIVCEDKDIPYCYTPSRLDIGTAMGVKRGSLMVLIKEHPEYKDLYDELASTMKTLAAPL